MPASTRIRRLAAAIFCLFALAALVSVGGNIKLALWASSPQLIPLLILFRARDRHAAIGAALVLGAFWIGGIALLFSGRDLVAIFLPIYEYALMVGLFVLLFAFSAVYLVVTGVLRLFGGPSKQTAVPEGRPGPAEKVGNG